LECIGVSVDTPSGTLHFTSAYLPGPSHSRDDLQNFKGDLMSLTHQSSSFLYVAISILGTWFGIARGLTRVARFSLTI
jgi:hypothetical protein